MITVRIVPEFPGLVIADTGLLWGPSGQRLEPFPDKDGYLRFNLCLGAGRRRQYSVHTAVCTAYHGPKPEGADVVRHLDGDPANNRASNLRWGTYVENEADKRLHGRAATGERNPGAKLTEADVQLIRQAPRYYGFRRDLADRYGISVTTVSQIRAGETWRALV